MKTNDPNINDWLDDHIEAFLDGELTDEESARIESYLATDGKWQQELTWAMNIRDELRAIPTPACPPHVDRAILNEVRSDARAEFRSRLLSGFDALLPQWRPALAVLTLFVAALAIVLTLNRPDLPPPAQETVSQAEVEQALVEAKWALGYVSQTGRLAGTSVQNALAPLLKEQTKE